MATTANLRGSNDEDSEWGQFSQVDELGRRTTTPTGAAAQTLPTQKVAFVLETAAPKLNVAVSISPRKLEVVNFAPSLASSSASSAKPLSKKDNNANSCPDFGSLTAARSRVSTSGITFSEAKGEIWKERLRGSLLKQGFRHRKQWVARWVVLSGRMLTYFVRPQDETSYYRNARGSLELTGETVVAYEHDDRVFGFVIFPLGDKRRSQQQQQQETRRSLSTVAPMSVSSPTSPSSVDLIPIARVDDETTTVTRDTTSTDEEDAQGGSCLACGVSSSSGRPSKKIKPRSSQSQKNSSSSSWLADLFFGGSGKLPSPQEEVWCFRARSASERETWVRAIQRLVALIRRVEMAPTLVGVGSIDYHYELKHDIGAGRFGTVKLAVAKSTGNLFAVKVLNRAKFASSPDTNLALNMEIRIIKRITRQNDHPNICKTYHSFADNFLVFLVMEYLGGGSLQQRIEQRGKYQEREASNVIFQIASALKDLHYTGIVLCDLNPGNLLYERPDNDIIKVVEFGRALIMPGPTLA